MKKLFAVLISVLLNANLFANDQQKDPFITRTFPAGSIRSVEASTSGGSIAVSGNAATEAVVEVFASRSNWSADEIKRAFDENYTIDIKVENGKLCVTAKQKNSRFNWNQQGLNISIKISVAKQTNSNLQTSGGSIQISDLSGTQDFKTSGGSMTVENVSGNIKGRTSGGSITVANANDNIDLSTSGGSITAKDCSGKISLKTSGGSVKMNNLNGDIQATTSGGSVSAKDVKGTLKTGTSGGSVTLDGISGSVNAGTSGGSMNVTMEAVSDYVKLSNSGSVHLTLPDNRGYKLKVKGSKVETSGLKDFRGNIESRSVEGTVGNGGAEIEIKTSQRASVTFK